MKAKAKALTPALIERMKVGRMSDPACPGLSIEMLPTGKRVWKYRRRVAESPIVINQRLGLYPVYTLAAARTWATTMNKQAEKGLDPLAERRQREAAAALTVDYCHDRYMEAVRENKHRTKRTMRAKPIKPRTIEDKIKLYRRNVQPKLGSKHITDVTEADLDAIIIKMSDSGAETQANRTGAEMRVFFGWCCSRRGEALGIRLKANPCARVGELWNPQAPRARWLDHDELPAFLRALAAEPVRLHRRALLLLLLTGVRKSELLMAPSSEVRDGKWIIPAERTKNAQEHPITLPPWTAKLIATNDQWIITSPKDASAPMLAGWPKVIERVRKRMETILGRPVEHITPHDLRRTMRSHVEDHDIDEALAERMINHKLTGLRETYNRNKRASAMAEGFAKWDRALAQMAIKAGVGDALEVVITTEAETPTIAAQLGG